ncbi:hypothetical protein GCM10010330_28500 [Streptomyces tendae]|nr:hypothetical protein GCM10010330_28500 [Streptomyces tendae]
MTGTSAPVSARVFQEEREEELEEDMADENPFLGLRSWEAGSGRRSGREGDHEGHPGIAKDGVEHGHQPHLPVFPLLWSTIERERGHSTPAARGRVCF